MEIQQVNTLSMSVVFGEEGAMAVAGVTQVVLLTSGLPGLTDSWLDFYVTLT